MVGRQSSLVERFGKSQSLARNALRIAVHSANARVAVGGFRLAKLKASPFTALTFFPASPAALARRLFFGGASTFGALSSSAGLAVERAGGVLGGDSGLASLETFAFAFALALPFAVTVTLEPLPLCAPSAFALAFALAFAFALGGAFSRLFPLPLALPFGLPLPGFLPLPFALSPPLASPSSSLATRLAANCSILETGSYRGTDIPLIETTLQHNM